MSIISTCITVYSRVGKVELAGLDIWGLVTGAVSMVDRVGAIGADE
jgi:hypothetical protein